MTTLGSTRSSSLPVSGAKRRFGALTLAAGLLALGTVVGANQALAQQGGGGFAGPGPAVVTVEQAKTMQDDARVVLQGRIVKPLGGKDYVFQDETGTTNIEVDRKAWAGQEIAPTDLVEIHGKVERKITGFKEIEVKRVIRLPAQN